MLPQASSIAGQMDWIFGFIVGISLLFLVLITGAMIYFAVRYHHTRQEKASDIEGNLWLEIIWTVIPTILVFMMFWYGWDGFRALRAVPADAVQLKVLAKKWSWVFTYPDGRQTSELYLPVGKPVKLSIESKDVIHSFFVAAFRVKEDAVPGQVTYVSFTPTQIGIYDIQCAEYCGKGHSAMFSLVHVLSEHEFEEWAAGQEEEGGEVEGLSLLKTKGCLSCHSTDGTLVFGPSFKGLWGRTERVVSNGAERDQVADAEYIKRSILEPDRDVVKGFDPGMMPSGAGEVSDHDLEEIVEYLETLK